MNFVPTPHLSYLTLNKREAAKTALTLGRNLEIMGAFAAKTVVSWTDHAGHDHDGPIITRAKGYDVIGCATCGFSHVVPLPDAADLDKTYREAYYSEEKPSFLAHAAEDQEWAELAQKDRLQ